MNETVQSTTGGPEDIRKMKQLESKVVKLRQENSTLITQVDKATRLLEREIGEIVDIDQLSKDDSQWKGRAQKIELYKTKIK